MQKKVIKKKKKSFNEPGACARQRLLSLSYDRAVIFQAEIVVTSQEGQDVTPAASPLVLFGPNVLVGGHLMAAMPLVFSVQK